MTGRGPLVRVPPAGNVPNDHPEPRYRRLVPNHYEPRHPTRPYPRRSRTTAPPGAIGPCATGACVSTIAVTEVDPTREARTEGDVLPAETTGGGRAVPASHVPTVCSEVGSGLKTQIHFHYALYRSRIAVVAHMRGRRRRGPRRAETRRHLPDLTDHRAVRGRSAQRDASPLVPDQHGQYLSRFGCGMSGHYCRCWDDFVDSRERGHEFLAAPSSATGSRSELGGHGPISLRRHHVRGQTP